MNGNVLYHLLRGSARLGLQSVDYRNQSIKGVRSNPQPRFADITNLISPTPVLARLAASRSCIELVNPVLRNFVGVAILAGAAWSPFKWLVLAFSAVIGDQIKRRFLTRVARNLLRWFLVVYGHNRTQAQARRPPTVA